MWHDNETTVDYINFRLVAKASAQLIREADGEPISIGISGGWGTGKSSLVRMIESELIHSDNLSEQKQISQDHSEYLVVTFNPWLYQGFEDARTALLQTVGDVVYDAVAKNQSLYDKAQSLLRRINYLRLAQFGGEIAATLLTGVPIGEIGRGVKATVEAFEEYSVQKGCEAVEEVSKATAGIVNKTQPKSLPKEIQTFRNELEELLQELGVTLVVFVDDLDRCLPKTAISTLEAIRLLLFLRRSAFVIAADDLFIRGAVRVHFAGTALSDEITTNYFDKLIQVPLRVPRLGINETKAYTAMLFLEDALRNKKITEADFKLALSKVETRLQETWKGEAVDLPFLESLVGIHNRELLGLMGLAERLAPLLFSASIVQANPRLIKRFLNTVFLRRLLAQPQNIAVDVPSLAKWHLLERCNENIANALAEYVSAETEGRIPPLQAAEATIVKDPKGELPPLFGENIGENMFVREWLRLEPMLGNLDMRPILHLSRDVTIRDFGIDDLNKDGKELRDALVEAKRRNESLTQLIRKVGCAQAGIALARAWEANRTSRTIKSGEEVCMLIEVTNVYPELGARAAALVEQINPALLTPAFVVPLTDRTWMSDVLLKWMNDSQTPSDVKRFLQKQEVHR